MSRGTTWRRGLSALGLLGLVGMTASPGQAQKRKAMVGVEPWQGQRVVMLLPLQLGPSWNADREFGTLLLAPAEAKLREVMEKTGKFSIIQPNRFSPILQRAVTEKRITDDELNALLLNPTAENARVVLGKFSFDQPPLLAVFSLDEVRGGGKDKTASVQISASGTLFQGPDTVPYRKFSETSDATREGLNNFERAVMASRASFNQIVYEFVKPINDILLPSIETADGKPAGGKPTAGSTDTSGQQVPASSEPLPTAETAPAEAATGGTGGAPATPPTATEGNPDAPAAAPEG